MDETKKQKISPLERARLEGITVEPLVKISTGMNQAEILDSSSRFSLRGNKLYASEVSGSPSNVSLGRLGLRIRPISNDGNQNH